MDTPQQLNIYTCNGLAQVSRVWHGQALKDWVHQAVAAIGGFEKAIRPGDTVLLKPNYNAPGPPPVSTDVAFLTTLIELIKDCGARRVIVGESGRHPPTSTRVTLRKRGVFEAAARAGAEVAVFDEGEWVPVPTNGPYFGTVEIARPVLECDRLVYACCLKTHRWSHFTISIKLSVGMVRPRDRLRLHLGGHFQEKIAELASLVRPDLIMVDGRTCFIRGGPAFFGVRRRPNVILASGDRVAVDIEGIKIIQSFPGNALKQDPWRYRQVRAAVALGLGVASEAEYEVIDKYLAPAPVS